MNAQPDLAIMKSEQKEKGLTKITNYLEAPAVTRRFAEIMGERGGKTYVASVLIAVAESKSLQECAPDSIYISALRAATLRLSVDASTGQAYMVPFKDRATLIVGYKGLHDMAVRTNRYRYINVSPIYEGEEAEENRFTGLHELKRDLSKSINKNNIIGWLGAFEMMNGYAHTLYMSHDEIHEHAQKYSASYNIKGGVWDKETRKMERKTVLRLLLRRWGFLDPADVQELSKAEEENEVVEGEALKIDNSIIEAAEAEDKAEAPRTKAENLSQLGIQDSYPYIHADIIAIVMKEKKLERQVAIDCLIQAHEMGKIGDELTARDAQAFAEMINA